MWRVFEHRRIDKQLQKDIVSISGPVGLRKIRGFRDEALRGDRKGFRSSRLGIQYRVLYKAEAQRMLVNVVELTPHDSDKMR